MNEIEQEFEKNVAELWKLDRERIKSLERELKEAQAACEEWKGKFIESAFDVSKLKADIRQGNIPLESKLDQTLKERDQAQAAAAVKTDLLRAVRYSMDREVPFPSLEKITAAIDVDCGTAFLARMAEAEWLVSHSRWNSQSREWISRQQAFLKGEGVKA